MCLLISKILCCCLQDTILVIPTYPYSAAADGQHGSNVYEVNQWLWQFQRGKPRLGGPSVEETDDGKEGCCSTRTE